MPKICAITGKRTVAGNNVSHANNKVRRKFRPNLSKRRIWVESRKRYITLLISAKGQRILDKRGADVVLAEKGLI